MKKLFNRFMAAVLASSCMLSSVAMNSNAVSTYKSPITTEEELLADGYVKFDDHGLLHDSGHGSEFVGAYIKDGNYYTLRRQPAHIRITFPPKNNIDEFVDMLYDRYPYEEGYWRKYPSETRNAYEACYTIVDDLNKLNLPGNARDILNDITSVTDIYQFTYADSMEWVSGSIQTLCKDINDYILLSDEEVERLQKYVEENNLDFTVEVSVFEKTTKRCHLIPNRDMTIDEQFEIAARIHREVKLLIKPSEMLGMGGMLISEDEVLEVDVLNAVDGDANEDGNVNMADATSIVQAIGNPDMYALSPQGEFNADTDGDGLTGMDAIEIQMKVASAGMPE